MSITGSDLYVKGNIEFDGKIYGDGSLLTGINAISGLTDNYITRANGATAIENSIIYDSGTNIGIGTTAPVAKLHIGDAGTVPNAMPITGSDAYIKGNLELDGNLYGTGSILTGPVINTPTPLNVTTSGIAAPPATILRITGNPGAVVIPNSTIQIAAGTAGQTLVLIGTSDANTVKFHNNDGLKLSQGVSFTLGQGDMLNLVYDATLGLWVELARSNN
jgi:hypothetical protein